MIFSRKKRTTPRRRSRGRVPLVERLEERALLTATPFGATAEDTGEFMLGSVYVTVVAFESNGVRDANLENWNDAYRNQVKSRIEEGLQWWEDTLDASFPNHQHDLNFQVDFTYLDAPIATGYEPISRPSYDFQLWTDDFFDAVGTNSSDFSGNSRAFNHAQRELHGTDWAFTIFVVNDQNDGDGRFAPGGFDRAFSFAGGRFFVTPAGRPDSTIAHEAAHMFWGRDEYRGGGNYDTFRGYYDAQNFNAWDNPVFLSGAEQRQPSILDRGACDEGGGLLCDAYLAHTSSDSMFAMIGWLDSDGDGIFDVLDVPLTLEGVGSYDAAQNEYHFVGSSSVQTLPNQNSSGTQNDITINHVSVAQYRIDGGVWLNAQRYDDFTANLDLRIPLAAGQQIEIRTIDDRTSSTNGISSPIFTGNTDAPSSTLLPGINGMVWEDRDADGRWDADETGLAGRSVQLVDQDGIPLQLRQRIEPDAYSSSTLVNTVHPGVTLSAVGSGVSDPSVFVISRSPASTGTQVFAAFSSACGGFCADWVEGSRSLRMDFTGPVSTVSIDAISGITGDGGRLEIYDANDSLLARYNTAELASGAFETMTLSRPTADISYAIAQADVNSTIRLDNLRFGPKSSAVTDARGVYRLPGLAPGTYRVQLESTNGDQPTVPASGQIIVTLTAGQAVGQVDFGVTMSGDGWQNPRNRLDVNDDGFVTPNDVLLIVNYLNTFGPQELTDEPTPPYLDVNGEGLVTANDALVVINAINAGGNSEGEAPTPLATAPASPVVPQPESEGDALLAWGDHKPVSVGGSMTHDRPGFADAPPLTVQPRVNQTAHLGWWFGDLRELERVTSPATGPAESPASEDTLPFAQPDSFPASNAQAHDRVLRRASDEDDALLPPALDDDLVGLLAADTVGRI